MRLSSSSSSNPASEGEPRSLNSELWHACAGPLVSLPAVESRVVYFPQGHSEQVAASTNKEIDSHIPNYPSLPPQLICQLHDVTMHADAETDEVYAQMTLQPLSPQEQKEPFLPAELGAPSKQPTNYFCKTLTASDTSTHGGFSVPRRAAEKDFSQQPPAQELIARDLHGNEWKFRHIFRGQPKRHLLTTGWSVFVSAKRLVAGDSVLFIWNDSNQLLLGIRRACRTQTVMPSSVLSSDSMHIGLLAAAAHATATNSRFTIFYNPRASPSEFVIPLAKYVKAVYHTRVSVGMRFRMLFETEESSVRRYMGTITGISDLDAGRWPNSHWRSVKVGWDESTAGERQPRVSLWEIEPLTTFPMYPSPFPVRLKRPWPSGLPSLHGIGNGDFGMSSPLMWLRDGNQGMQSLNFQGFGGSPWIQPGFDASMLGLQPDMYQAMAAAALQEVPFKQPASAALQFQQQQNLTTSSTLLPNQILPHVQPKVHQALLPMTQGNQISGQAESQLQHQLQQSSHLLGQQPLPVPQQLQLHQQIQQQSQVGQEKPAQISNVLPDISQLTSVSEPKPSGIQTMLFPQPLMFADSNASLTSPLQSIFQTFSQEETSDQVNLPNLLCNSIDWPSKRVTLESVLSPRALSAAAPFEKSVSLLPQANSPEGFVSLPPLPGKRSPVDQIAKMDPQNRQLFGVNIDPSSFLMQNGMTAFLTVGGEPDSTVTSYAGANFLDSTGIDFPLSHTMSSSSCLEENGLLQPSENSVGQGSSQLGTFVKVYKSGSFGRSLDITRFSSYEELRGELECLFGLEGQLEEDPLNLRSGWQLVFVDRENDVLLLGDGPWQEFVNNVWCIRILSPQEVQQMTKQEDDLLNSVPLNRLSSSSCDDYVGRQGTRNISSGITPVETFDY